MGALNCSRLRGMADECTLLEEQVSDSRRVVLDAYATLKEEVQHLGERLTGLIEDHTQQLDALKISHASCIREFESAKAFQYEELEAMRVRQREEWEAVKAMGSP